jgi:hypothetical protein
MIISTNTSMTMTVSESRILALLLSMLSNRKLFKWEVGSVAAVI